MTSTLSRRRFLSLAAKYSMLGAAAPLGLNLAGIRAASAANVSSNYKALVCVFLYGGNDSHNTIIPYDSATYKKYADIRGALAVPRADLAATVITPTNGWEQGRQFALHPMLAPLKTLFDDGKLVPVMNVGSLLQPTTLADYRNKRNLPRKLMSHDDQFSFWQSLLVEGTSTGWGGRLGDLFEVSNLPNSQLTSLSFGNSAIFSSGKNNAEFNIDPTPYKTADWLTNFSAFLNRTHNMPKTELGNQLAKVAKTIAANQDLGMKRQVFFVSMGGFDHHIDLVNSHPALLKTVANALSAFQNEMDALGLGSQVTTFTASDFGRSLVTNGDGADHGWGGHHFVMGGAVKAKTWVGALPAFTPKASDDIGGGRLLPAISVDQYAATLAHWMGVTDSELPTIFPYITRFNTKNLGFMA